MTNRDQSYVYVTQSLTSWMTDLVDATPAAGRAPLNSFVLPGAHDAGMFDPTALDSILNSDQSNFLLGLLDAIVPGLGDVGSAIARRVFVNVAFTQKDSTRTMLDLGARYFDIRPGYLKSPMDEVNSGIFHQHNFVPGASYEMMLVDVLEWLDDHPRELVVLDLGNDGFRDSGQMTPSSSTLESCLQQALETTSSSVNIGHQNSFALPFGDLVANNTRLLVVNRIYDDVKVYGSYDGDAYTTLDVNQIIACLNGMTAGGQTSKDYTVLSLQGTASGTPEGIKSQIPPKSYAASPLLATKGMFDSVTYPWAYENVTRRLSNDQLLILQNDFVDNALADYAVRLTRTRL